jgi:diguanylate cyclase (GGDEF)-like protein/putative nucleotidyltransferase with HDIG domain
MAHLRDLRPLARAYVVAVVLLGAATLVHSVHQLYVDPIGSQWFILAGLTLLTGSFTVKVPSTNASLSVSETFVFASVLFFGAAAGAITVSLECLIILFWMTPGGRSLQKILFNVAAPAIAIWISGTTFFWISGIQPYSRQATPLQGLFLPLAIFTSLYFLLNSWLVALALGFETNRSPITIWWTNFTWLSVNYFSGASVAALIVTYSRQLDFGTLAIIIPLLVVSYLTFRTAMGRVEDSNHHLNELNRLYLSTIETLAMAIDAKDQITHGHIRRVQTYAIGLAKHVGVANNSLIKAIEAAALLHDMGKLAVPEYILNKPGKLTAAEFDKMKRHASVGADILSAIEFPYPVVPIVRHHHENWDGSGYPDGLRGTGIPIGARILSVVDCFDALTSDRPYRPRLSNDEALQILADRRGSMYDPWIVDTFARVHDHFAPKPLPPGLTPHALNEITSSTQAATSRPIETPRLGDARSEIDGASAADEMLRLFELGRASGQRLSLPDVSDLVVKHLRRLIPSSLYVFYLYNRSTDELEMKCAIGEGASSISSLRIPLGQRLSGWVAANRRTIMNSDPILDFGDTIHSMAAKPQSCLSTPLITNEQLVGVLTFYSSALVGFTEDHQRIAEGAATQIALTLQRASAFDDSLHRDSVTHLPGNCQFEEYLESVTAESSAVLLLVDVINLDQIRSTHGAEAADNVLRHVVRQMRSGLRFADIMFRYSSHELVAVLNETDEHAAATISATIRRNIYHDLMSIPSGSLLNLDATVTCLKVPGASSLRDAPTTPTLGARQSIAH